MLRDVLPSPTIGDGVDRWVGQSRSGCQILVRHSRRPLGANPSDQLLGRNGEGVVLAPLGLPSMEVGPITRWRTAPIRFVSHVVQMSAEAQVGRVHARWVVAGMEDVHPIGDRSVVDLPGDTVGSSVATAFLDDTVSIDRSIAGPVPTLLEGSFTHRDELPETGRGRGSGWTHRDVPAVRRTVGRGSPPLLGVGGPAALANVMKRHESIIPWDGAHWSDEKRMEEAA